MIPRIHYARNTNMHVPLLTEQTMQIYPYGTSIYRIKHAVVRNYMQYTTGKYQVIPHLT
jgi:hypothetical protein